MSSQDDSKVQSASETSTFRKEPVLLVIDLEGIVEISDVFLNIF